jgi:hypothetical protein
MEQESRAADADRAFKQQTLDASHAHQRDTAQSSNSFSAQQNALTRQTELEKARIGAANKQQGQFYSPALPGGVGYATAAPAVAAPGVSALPQAEYQPMGGTEYQPMGSGFEQAIPETGGYEVINQDFSFQPQGMEEYGPSSSAVGSPQQDDYTGAPAPDNGGYGDLASYEAPVTQSEAPVALPNADTLTPAPVEYIDTASEGKQRIDKNKLVYVHKNEAIIPAHLNPFISEDERQSAERERKMRPGMVNGIPAYAEGTPRVETDEERAAAERAFAPGLYGVKQIGNAISAIPNAIYENVQKPLESAGAKAGELATRAMQSPSPEYMGRAMQGIAAQGGSPPVPAYLNKDAIPSASIPSAVAPEVVAQNNAAIAGAQAAIAKPQMDYATWAKANPTMAGKGDALMGGVVASPQAQAGLATLDRGALPQAKPAYAPTGQGPGGGTMTSYDQTGQASTQILPTNEERASQQPKRDLRKDIEQQISDQYYAGKLSHKDAIAGISALQQYDNQKIKGGLPGLEEKMNMRYETDQKKAEAAHARKIEDVQAKEHHELYQNLTKDWRIADKIEDPHEKVKRQMEINRDYFQAVLPPEAQQLAEVPIDPRAAIYQAKMKLKGAIVEQPDNADLRKAWITINTPAGEQEILADHQKRVALRNSYLQRNRTAQRR